MPKDYSHLLERLVVTFESIGKSLEGLHEEAKRAGSRYWPEPREPREAIVTRIPTEEDKAKENQGRIDESVSIDDWLDFGNPEELWGEREREWHRTHPKQGQKSPATGADAGPIPDSGSEGGSLATVEGQIGAVGDSAPDNPAS